MEKTKLTQCDKVLRHLRDHGYITSLEAINEYGILRLSARIADLKKQGIPIASMWTTGKNRYGEPIKYSVYTLMEGCNG